MNVRCVLYIDEVVPTMENTKRQKLSMNYRLCTDFDSSF